MISTHQMFLQHGELDVRLLRERPPLGVLEEEVEQVRPVQVRPLLNRLRDHVHVRQTLKQCTVEKDKLLFDKPGWTANKVYRFVT